MATKKQTNKQTNKKELLNLISLFLICFSLEKNLKIIILKFTETINFCF